MLSAVAALMLGFAAHGRPADTHSSPVLEAMKAELARSRRVLAGRSNAPYYLGYTITQMHTVVVESSFGKLTLSNEYRHRQLDVDLRVGDYKFDNTHLLRGAEAQGQSVQRYNPVEVPIDDDPDALRAVLWFVTDQRYKQALEQYAKAKTNSQVATAQEDKSDDFIQEPPQKYYDPAPTFHVDRRAWEGKVRQYTAPFAAYSDIYEATALLRADLQTRWYVNSEGSEIQTSQTYYRLSVSSYSKADDGMELPRYETYFAFTPEGLPSDQAVLDTVQRMIQDLQALRRAPAVDPYAGPALLSGRAAGVFFHEVFGHRIEGHRQKNENESQTFKDKVGQKVLPENFTVYFDPTLRRLGPTDLLGSYAYDDQGVKAQRVTVVQDGVFKSFLMSRTPIEGFPHSNGHGRAQPGFMPVARQSNLVVEVSKPVSHEQLKAMLIEQVKKENKPFGLYFEDIQGGFTLTGRVIPNAFNVLPVMVYRVYPDGREELVRGVDLIGTPLIAFSKIVTGDDQVRSFNGICGAESGGVPVSASSPGVLISQIEVQKKVKSQERPPILPAPFEDQP